MIQSKPKARCQHEDTDGSSQPWWRRMREFYSQQDSLAVLALAMNLADEQLLEKVHFPSAHQAAKAGDLRTFQYIIRRGFAPNLQDGMGRTAGHLAARGGVLSILQYWHAAGGRFDVFDTQGETVLFAACRGGHSHVVAWILENGASSSGYDIYNASVLHAAVESRCDADVIRALCAAGAPLNRMDLDGNTALHLAVETGHATGCLALLVAGADPTLVNGMGLTPDAMPRHSSDDKGYACSVAFVTRQRWSYQLLGSRRVIAPNSGAA